jgi:hypothetical protein
VFPARHTERIQNEYHPEHINLPEVFHLKHLNSILPSCISQLHSAKNAVVTPKNQSNSHKRYNKRLTPQQWQEKELRPFELENELVHHITNKHETYQKLVNDLIYLSAQGIIIEVSQAWIAERLDICLRQANRLVANMKDEKVGDTYTRGMEMTAITRLTPMLARPSIWAKLQDVLPVCKSLTKGLILYVGLLSSPKTLSKWAHVVGLKNNYLYINKEYKKNIPSTPKIIQEEPKTGPPKVAATAEEAKRIIDAFLATLG